MEINLPEIISSNEIGYYSLIKIFNTCKETTNSKVFFNFKNLKFIEANLCSVFGCVLEKLRENNCTYHFVGLQKNVEDVFNKNNFLTHYFDIEKIEDDFNTTIQYKSFHKEYEDDVYELYVQEELINKKDFPQMSENLTVKILENIFEIFVNAKTHGRCEYIHSCGQFFPNRKYKPLNFTIVDLGVNIKENVNSALNEDFTACEAIKWAMIEGNTTKTHEPGGLGLSVIFQFIQLNKGKFEVVSSNGYYKFSEGIVKTLELNYEFPGTIVNFTFNLDDENSYYI
jgi:anti-anti-sigma regulatory factor